MRILNGSQLNQLTLIDSEVSQRASKILKVLDDEYGIQRQLSDDGGYVLIVQDNNQPDIKELEDFLRLYDQCIVEYVDIFIGDDGQSYCELLLLISSDYGVTIYMKQQLFAAYETKFRWN
ncbi:hypothetical protein PNU17_12280 [Turicibacter sanguinis]|uniref:hypothetical protein n=1 Tax=Turicibacter sanguinis TaxID=154288 RepID=UPI00189C2FD3|nr:hypothetical protein [Turicibacter sanguinis]MDB8556545.1 hypothetical protein [Turicibacter sanguinis]